MKIGVFLCDGSTRDNLILANVSIWGSPVERERKRRRDLSVWSYAYEFHAHSIVDDHTFTAEAHKVDLTIDTGRPHLDHFFKTEFAPYTGAWIYKHPELSQIERLYYAHHAPK